MNSDANVFRELYPQTTRSTPVIILGKPLNSETLGAVLDDLDTIVGLEDMGNSRPKRSAEDRRIEAAKSFTGPVETLKQSSKMGGCKDV